MLLLAALAASPFSWPGSIWSSSDDAPTAESQKVDAKDREIASLRAQLHDAQSESATLRKQKVLDDVSSPQLSLLPAERPSLLFGGSAAPRLPSMLFGGGLPMMGGMPSLFEEMQELPGMGSGMGGAPRCVDPEAEGGECECTVALPKGDTTEAGDVAVKSHGNSITLKASDQHAGHGVTASVKHSFKLSFAPKHVNAAAERGGADGDVLKLRFGPMPPNGTCTAAAAQSTSESHTESGEGHSFASSSFSSFSSSNGGMMGAGMMGASMMGAGMMGGMMGAGMMGGSGGQMSKGLASSRGLLGGLGGGLGGGLDGLLQLPGAMPMAMPLDDEQAGRQQHPQLPEH